MKHKQSCRTESRRPDRFRAQALLSLALAVLFAFQGILVNSHVHLPVLSESSAIAPLATAGSSTVQVNHHKTQTPDMDGTCALCLAVALIGAYSLPAVVLLHLPAEFLSLERAYSVYRHTVPVHHRAWQSRAPPIA